MQVVSVRIPFEPPAFVYARADDPRVSGRIPIRQDFGFRPCEGAHQRAYPLP